MRSRKACISSSRTRAASASKLYELNRLAHQPTGQLNALLLGRRFSLPSSVTRAADLFRPEFNLRHRLVPQRGASVLLPFCRSTTPRLRGSPLLYDLLFWVDAPVCFAPGSATVDANRAALNLQALPNLVLTSANFASTALTDAQFAYFYKANRQLYSLSPGDTLKSADGSALADPDKVRNCYGSLLTRGRARRDYDSFRSLIP
jgi:hypothetical protein